jgi:hypothetical protein
MGTFQAILLQKIVMLALMVAFFFFLLLAKPIGYYENKLQNKKSYGYFVLRKIEPSAASIFTYPIACILCTMQCILSLWLKAHRWCNMGDQPIRIFFHFSFVLSMFPSGSQWVPTRCLICSLSSQCVPRGRSQ